MYRHHRSVTYHPVLVTPPTIKPVTLAEAKAHCRVDHDDDDGKLTALIAAATSYADGWTGILGRCLVEQTWRQDFDCFHARLRLPLFPVISVSSVKYTDTNSVEQTVASANYSVLADDLGTYVQFIYNYAAPPLKQFLPAAVRVEYVAGYANTADDPPGSTVPDTIKQGLLLLISHWYENRDAVVVGARAQAVSVPMAAEALLSPFRRPKF